MGRKRDLSGSMILLLMGLLALVTAGGLAAVLVRCVDCPMERHRTEATAVFAWSCPRCGGWGEVNQVTLWNKVCWRPRRPVDWLEFPPEERPTSLSR